MAAVARTVQLASYGSIAAPLAILIVPLYNYLPAFYASEVGLNMTVIGIIFFTSRLWDGLLDPLIGLLSDRTQTRLGARKPWIAGGALGLLGTAFLVCIPPSDAGYIYLTLGLFALYVAWACVQIPHLAWGAELASGYLDRSKVVMAREIFSLLGILSAVLLPVLLFGTENFDLRKMMLLYAGLVAVLIPLTTALALRFAPSMPVAAGHLRPTWRDAVSLLRGRSPFRKLCGAYFMMQLGATAYDSVVVFLVTRVLGLPQYFLLLAAFQFILTIASMPLLAWLGSRWDKRVLLAGFTVLFPVGVAMLAFAPHGSLPMAIVAYTFIGVSTAPYRIMPTSMAADCAEMDIRKRGIDRTATHMAVVTFFSKLALAAGVGLAFPLLDLIGFDSRGVSSVEADMRLRFVAAVLPAICMLAAFMILRRYPLNRAALVAREAV